MECPSEVAVALDLVAVVAAVVVVVVVVVQVAEDSHRHDWTRLSKSRNRKLIQYQ